MKKTALIFSLTSLAFIADAQNVNFAWAKQIGECGSNNAGNLIAVDASGNVYTTGRVTGTVDFDPGPGVFNLSSSGPENFFVSKLNAAGNFVWAKQMSGSGQYCSSNSITVDAQGNVYTTGHFSYTVDFDPGLGVFNLSAPTEDLFVSKLDACGNFVWAKQIGAPIDLANDRAVGRSIAVDASGNVYTTGYFHGTTVDFDPGPGLYILNSGYNIAKIFVSKLDAAGNFVWAKQMVAIADGSGSAGASGKSIAVDISGNVYTTGNYAGTVDFDPGPGNFYMSSISLMGTSYVSKLNAAGNFVWANQTAGQNMSTGAWATSIALDASGNVYTAGSIFDLVDFDPGPGSYFMNSTNGNSYILKLDAAGNFNWAKQIGGGGYASLSSITQDASGNIYATGSFVHTADMDPGTGTVYLTSAGLSDVFISKMDTNGELIWVKQMGGNDNDLGNSITLDGSGNIYTTGAFGGTVEFDPGLSVYNLTSIGASDIFIHKMSRCTNNNTSSTITVSTCSSYTLNCQVYTSSGVYTQILLNTAGCDSILTLNLTINNTNSTFNVNAAACNSYFWNGQTYTISGTYTDTLIAASGCDSIVTLYLTINPKLFSTITQSICSGQTYSGHSTSGIYIDTLVATNGCDSIITLQLTVMPKPAPDLGADKEICSGDSVILYPGLFTTYNWQNGSTQSHVVAKQPGLYAVVVTDNCNTARDEILIKENTCDIYFPSAFTPNSDGKNDWFKILGGYNLKEYHLLVYNRWGQKVFETFEPAKGWNGIFNGQLQSSATFVWYCEFSKQGNTGKTKKKGTITLIR